MKVPYRLSGCARRERRPRYELAVIYTFVPERLKLVGCGWVTFPGEQWRFAWVQPPLSRQSANGERGHFLKAADGRSTASFVRA